LVQWWIAKHLFKHSTWFVPLANIHNSVDSRFRPSIIHIRQNKSE
jgi:hypothetical protein